MTLPEVTCKFWAMIFPGVPKRNRTENGTETFQRWPENHGTKQPTMQD